MQNNLVRMHQWHEWLPMQTAEVGLPPQPQQMPDGTVANVEQRAQLHRGFTAFQSDSGEKLVDLHLVSTGQIKECAVFPDDDQSAEPEVKLFGLYIFTAVLVRPSRPDEVSTHVEKFRNFIAKAEEQQKTMGRDRRGDLVIVEHGQPHNNSKM